MHVFVKAKARFDTTCSLSFYPTARGVSDGPVSALLFVAVLNRFPDDEPS